jgi:hypothetical protein
MKAKCIVTITNRNGVKTLAITDVEPRGIADGNYTLEVKGEPLSVWEHDKYGWKRLETALVGKPFVVKPIKVHIDENPARAMPTIDLTDDELTAVAATVRRLIREDGFPQAPRLDPLRSALAKLDRAAQPRSPTAKSAKPAVPRSKTPKGRPRAS